MRTLNDKVYTAGGFGTLSMSLPTLIFRCMLGAIAVVALLHIGVNMLPLGPDSVLLHLFDVGAEGNFPTWVGTLFWFTAGVAAATCAVAETNSTRARLAWGAIATLFFAASLDEATELHEFVGSGLRELMSVSSGLSPGSPWILFYAPVLAAIVTACVVFLFRVLKTSAERRCVFLGFFCFAIAIAMDFYQGMADPDRIALASAIGMNRALAVEASILLEEVLELLGCALLARAFFEHHRTRGAVVDRASTKDWI